MAISFLTVYEKAGTLHYTYPLIGLGVFTGLIYWGARAYKERRERMAGEQQK